MKEQPIKVNKCKPSNDGNIGNAILCLSRRVSNLAKELSEIERNLEQLIQSEIAQCNEKIEQEKNRALEQETSLREENNQINENIQQENLNIDEALLQERNRSVRAIISATTNYNGATVTSNFSILKMVPTLTWSKTPPTQMLLSSITKLEATSSNGEPVTYTTSNSNIAYWEMALWDGEYYNSLETKMTSGTVVLTASVAETTYYSSASISFTLKVTW